MYDHVISSWLADPPTLSCRFITCVMWFPITNRIYKLMSRIVRKHCRCTCIGALCRIPSSAPNTPRMRYFVKHHKSAIISFTWSHIVSHQTHMTHPFVFVFKRCLVVFGHCAHTLTWTVRAKCRVSPFGGTIT